MNLDGKHEEAERATQGCVAAGEECDCDWGGQGRRGGNRPSPLNLAVGLPHGACAGGVDGWGYLRAFADADVMLGIKGVRLPDGAGGWEDYSAASCMGFGAITIGSLVEQDKPLIWRGPMAHGAFKQLLLDNTEWPALDYLIVDLPPGTGDVPLTLCQLLPLTNAVVGGDAAAQVATDDAIRAVKMFNTAWARSSAGIDQKT